MVFSGKSIQECIDALKTEEGVLEALSSLSINFSNVFHVPATGIFAAEFPSLSPKLQADCTSWQDADKSIKDAEAVVLGHERRP